MHEILRAYEKTLHATQTIYKSCNLIPLPPCLMLSLSLLLYIFFLSFIGNYPWHVESFLLYDHHHHTLYVAHDIRSHPAQWSQDMKKKAWTIGFLLSSMEAQLYLNGSNFSSESNIKRARGVYACLQRRFPLPFCVKVAALRKNGIMNNLPLIFCVISVLLLINFYNPSIIIIIVIITL